MSRTLRFFPKLSLRKDFTLPERFKGTVLEKWANYWRSLFIDYKSMIVDLKTEIQEKPTKSLLMASGLAAAWKLAVNNPNEDEFKDSLRQYTNRLIIIGEPCQNRNTVTHFKLVENSLNQNTLRRLNLGVASILWIDDSDDDCNVYKNECKYLKPKYTSIPARIVDIGFAGRWWNLYRKFDNFDVNF